MTAYPDSPGQGPGPGTGPHGDTTLTGESFDKVLDSILVRYRRGDRISLAQYEKDHPRLAARLREVYPVLSFLAREANIGVTTAREGEPSSGSALSTVIPRERLGPYRLIREVGRGGMGVVFEAEEEGLQRRVAVKVLPYHSLMEPRSIERFHREARAAAGLRHPGIVPVYSMGEEEGIHFYAMEFIEGESLESVLAEVRRWKQGTPAQTGSRSSRLALQLLRDSTSTVQRENWSIMAPPSDVQAQPAAMAPLPAAGLPPPGKAPPPPEYYRAVARLGWQVAVALAYAHGRGVLHRDIKPANLLLDAEEKVWITDFGLAKTAEEGSVTRTGELMGTLRYMAPERFQGCADPRSDVYSLGVTLHELLTVEPASAPEVNRQAARERGGAALARPREIDPRIPLEIERIVLKATQLNQAHRYQSAAEVAVDLERFLGGRPVLARVPRRRPAALAFLRRHRRGAAALALLLAGVATLAVVAALAHRPRFPECMVAVDLDGDKDLDIAATTLEASSAPLPSGTLTLLANDGRGSFKPVGYFETGPLPSGLATGDLNEDGQVDLVVSSADSNFPTLFLGAGSGELQPASRLNLFLGTMRLLLADMDGDGIPDLVATRRDHRVAVLWNQGRGALTEPSYFQSVLEPCNMAAADLDGDGDPDLAVGSLSRLPSGNLGVHRNQGGRGFSQPATYDLGGRVWGVSAADFDGDRHGDLVAALDAFPYVAFLWNDGGGGFSKEVKVALPSPVSSICPADFDADGDLDLAVASEGYVGIIRNAGRRSLQAALRLEAGLNPNWAEVGDFNGDGSIDLAVLNQGSHDLTVFLNEGRGTFAAGRTAAVSRWHTPMFRRSLK